MTQRNSHLQNARQPHAAAALLRVASTPHLIALALASALLIALVLITGPTSAEYGIA